MATYGIDIITGLPYLISNDEGGTVYTEPVATPTNANYGLDMLTGEGYIVPNLVGEVVEGLPEANPSVYVYGLDMLTAEAYVVGKDGKIPAHDYADLELVNEFKINNSLYKEFIYTGANITQINYWSAADKLLKLFTKDITYTNSNPTSTSIKDETTGRVLTTVIAYSGNDILSITKTIA